MTHRPNSIRAFPALSTDLIEALQAAFPNKLPEDPATAPAQIAMMIGQQSVITFLRSRMEAHLRAQR